MDSAEKSVIRSFELTFYKKNKDLVHNSYLPYIMEEAILQKHKNKTIKIHTVGYKEMYNLHAMWKPVNFDHPATFETIAMESDQKDMILKDLERFMTRKEYYMKVGKAWKRGYLLFGPPGIGKSSLIAAMTNYLNFDIYYLELTALTRNSDLRKLLVATTNKSILVIEDIDCTINLQANLLNRAIYVSSDESMPMTPAEVAEQLLKEHEVEDSLKGFINFLHQKMKEKEEDKAKKVEITQMKSVDEKTESNGNGI
ncbi:hypothetical protein MTR67_011495 [Solanum verrucosum]|uniref:ATP binding protein n=1 Tax=Solanum verrucosum TaxID=315347 RepID=A0AAF0Q9I4_SOLVR|nr:hypothetical protein MTR67_011495 [Solanum verrucosum]